MPLYLNAGKLLLNGSQLAATRSCCCEEEGDSCEECGDYCLYKLEIVSPLPLASPPTPCLPFVVSEQDNNASFCAEQQSRQVSYLDKGYALQGGLRAIYEAAVLGLSNPYQDGSVIDASVELYCVNDLVVGPGVPYSPPKWFAAISLRAFLAHSIVTSATTKTSLRLLSSACSRKSNADCSLFDYTAQRTRGYLSTPLEFTVTYSSDGFGLWQNEDTYVPPQGDPISCGTQLADNFSVTFRITERRACTTVQCNCDANLNGLKAFFEGKEFTLGTDEIITEGNTTYEHYNEPITGAYQFFKTVYSPGDENCPVPPSVISLTDLSLTCETDNSVSPAVVRWLTTVTTSCTPVEIVDCEVVPTGFASRLFTANIPCYEAEDNCTGPVGGTHIPLGSPQDIVEDEDSPFLDPGLPNCGAPNFPDFRIEQACGA